MDLIIDGQKVKTYTVNFYTLGTDFIVAATVKNGQAAVDDARIWTDSKYSGKVGVKLAGGGSWSYPGSSSREGFSLGALSPSQEKAIEIKINFSTGPGENYVPIILGHD